MFHLLGLAVALFSAAEPTWASDDPLVNTPPPKPVRIPAELEPMQAVAVRWHPYADTVTALGVHVSALSAQRGGVIEIYLNAGLDNAQQSYHLAYPLFADSEPSEGPHAALPDTTTFVGFDGQLDDLGIGIARMTIAGPLPSDWVGTTIRLSLELTDQQNDAMDTVSIQILE